MTSELTQTSDEFVAARPETEGGVDRELRLNDMLAALTGGTREPTKLGRFVVLQRLGQGGMGTVYAAYDPHLDRRVALKLLRADQDVSEQARARMQREAHALARLSHPNVVPVHDVGLLDGELFIVMEFVEGKTLRGYVAEDKPEWSETLAAYLQAGEGLVAAHELGIVHRDFKPDNVIRGEDGRVRILDFGLARGVGSSEPGTSSERSVSRGSMKPPSFDMGEADTQLPGDSSVPDSSGEDELETVTVTPRSSSGLDARLTVTGAVMGTPAYMAPEQFLGNKVGPAADQFAFCASLFEALYGQRPYQGKTMYALRENVLLGRLEEPPRGGAGVPRWVLPVLRRGLSTAPEARFPSMAALVSELGRDRNKVRRRALALVGALGLAGLTGVSAWSYRGATADAPPSCTGAEELVAEVWGPPQREALRSVLAATGRDYAEEIGPRIDARLSRYAEDWAAMYGEACEVHLRKEQSDAIYDKRSVCLSRRRAALGSAVEVLLETTDATLAKAVDVVEQLPALGRCADLEALEAEVAPPADAEIAARVDELLVELIDAEAREHGGRLSEALAALDRLVPEVEALGYVPLTAELAHARGRVLVQMDGRGDASEALTRASTLALEVGDDELALEALARHTYAAVTLGVGEQPLARVEFAEALARRTPGSAFAHALLLNNLGVSHMARGETEAARASFERAAELRARAQLDELELYWIGTNLALVSEDSVEARALAEAAAEGFELKLGPNHPESLATALSVTHYLTSATQIQAERGPMCARYQRYHPDQPLASGCFFSMGLLALALDDEAAARAAFTAVRDLDIEEAYYERHLSRAYLLLFDGDDVVAEENFERLIGKLEPRAEQWWLACFLVHTQMGLARSLVERGEHTRAAQLLEQAVVRLRELTTLSIDADLQLALADARWRLAQVLGAHAEVSPEHRGRARDLAEEARAWFLSAGPGYADKLERIDAWLAR